MNIEQVTVTNAYGYSMAEPKEMKISLPAMPKAPVPAFLKDPGKGLGNTFIAKRRDGWPIKRIEQAPNEDAYRFGLMGLAERENKAMPHTVDVGRPRKHEDRAEIILAHLKEHGPTSRSTLAQKTKMGVKQIDQVTAQMRKDGLVSKFRIGKRLYWEIAE